jgi:hypothetical protein
MPRSSAADYLLTLKERDQFSFLTSTARVDDTADGLSTIKMAQRYIDLDAAYRRRWSDIDEMCASLAQFRVDLVQRLTDSSRRRHGVQDSGDESP